jgi:hypothetical protein
LTNRGTTNQQKQIVPLVFWLFKAESAQHFAEKEEIGEKVGRIFEGNF